MLPGINLHDTFRSLVSSVSVVRPVHELKLQLRRRAAIEDLRMTIAAAVKSGTLRSYPPNR